MNKPIKLGIVGLGRAGWGMHLEEIKDKTDKFEVVAACDIISERNEMISQRLNCKTYDKIEDLIADEEIEMVDIATRTCDHYKHAKMALEAGKSVLLEKPACMTYNEFADLLKISNKPGKPKLYVRQNRRFEAVFNEFLNIVNSGKLGNVFEIQISQLGYQRRDDWQTLQEFGGGQILNWGPHIIDQALVLLNSSIANMQSNLKHATAGGDCEDHFSILLNGKNGRTVTIWISGAVALNNDRRYIAYGDKGTTICDNNNITLKYINPEQVLPEVISDSGTPGMSFGSSGTFEAAVNPEWITEEKIIDFEDLTVIWDHIYESFRNGKTYPISDEEVLNIMKVITEAKKNKIIKTSNIK